MTGKRISHAPNGCRHPHLLRMLSAGNASEQKVSEGRAFDDPENLRLYLDDCDGSVASVLILLQSKVYHTCCRKRQRKAALIL